MLIRSSLPILVLLSLAAAPAARAQTPIHFWGLQRGCEHVTSTERQAEKQLHSVTQSFGLLSTPAGKPMPSCQGERCGQILRRACPGASGRVLGGQVVQGKHTSRFRLWLYDLSTGQIAYQDDYTHSPGLSDAFLVQAQTLLEKPRFGATPGPKPTYCNQVQSAGESAAIASARTGGPLYFAVHGDGKHKAALQAALMQQLQLLGRNPQPALIESRNYSVDEMQKLVAGQQNARVLGAEVNKEGKVDLVLFDQRTNLLQDSTVGCAGCDRDSLIGQVKEAVSELLERCFGMQCAQSGVQPPVEACEPFPEDRCAGLDEMLAPGAARFDQDRLTPRTAKLIKGLAWGAFAASAATGITLFALSGTSIGDYKSGTGVTVRNSFDIGAWTATGIAVGLLAISIPTTIVVDRAAARNVQPSSAEPTLIQCPN